MSDENHADTANVLNDTADSQLDGSDTTAPADNPTIATDSSGNNIILNEDGHHTADITSADTTSKQG